MAQKRSLRPKTTKSPSSASSGTAVESSMSAYTLDILRKRDIFARLPDFLSEDDEDDGLAVTKNKGKQKEEVAGADLGERVLQAFHNAHGNPAHGRWAEVVQLLKLSCTRDSDYRFLAPQTQQIESSKLFDLQLWAKEVSDLLRRQWVPKSGPEHEDNLLYQAQNKWKPTEDYPTRETAVIKQILEKKEWAKDIQNIVLNWLTTSTLDPLTEIRIILEKQRLVNALPQFLETLIPMDASDSAKVKNIEKEQWIVDITRYFQRNGARILIRNSTSNLSFNTREKKKRAIQEKVQSWQQNLHTGAEDDEQRASSDAGSSNSKQTAKGKPVQSKPIAKQSSLDFVAVKPSAARLVASGKAKGSPRNYTPPVAKEVDHDVSSSPTRHEFDVERIPSQLSFRSSQIKHSTPKDHTKPRAPSPIEAPAPSSSPLSGSLIHSSPSRRPRTISATNKPVPSFKRPRSPSPLTHSRATKQPRRGDQVVSLIHDSPMAIGSSPPSKHTCVVPADDSPMVESSTPSQGHDRASTTLPRVSSPNNPIPAASSADKAKAPDKKKLPTLTELLSARKAQAAAAGSPNKNKNTLALVSSPLNRKARLTELASTVAPEPIAIGTTAVETKDPPGRTSKESVQDSPGDDAAVLAPSDRGVSNNDVDIGQRKITQVPPAILETQASSSVMTATSSVQHQPEYTASGYAIDLPLSIIDGYVSRGVGAEDREQVGRKDKDPERGKISEKKMGHFGMDDVDTSPTKGRRGIVRPFVDAFEDEEEDDGTVLPRMEFSAFNESQLPDFTNNFSAFDPPQVSTQPRHSGGGQSRGGGGGNRARYGFGARPWESAGVDLDDEEEDEEDLDNDAGTSDYGYSAPQAIFTKDGVINVRSLDDDPTGQSPAFFSIPGLNSPIKKNRGRNHEAQTAFPFGYSSQMDVDGDVELVQRAMDRDGIMMDEDEEDGDHRMWGVGWP